MPANLRFQKKCTNTAIREISDVKPCPFSFLSLAFEELLEKFTTMQYPTKENPHFPEFRYDYFVKLFKKPCSLDKFVQLFKEDVPAADRAPYHISWGKYSLGKDQPGTECYVENVNKKEKEEEEVKKIPEPTLRMTKIEHHREWTTIYFEECDNATIGLWK